MSYQPKRNIEVAREALANKNKKEYEQILKDMIAYATWLEGYATGLSEQLSRYSSAYLSSPVTTRAPLP